MTSRSLGLGPRGIEAEGRYWAKRCPPKRLLPLFLLWHGLCGITIIINILHLSFRMHPFWRRVTGMVQKGRKRHGSRNRIVGSNRILFHAAAPLVLDGTK